MLESYTSSTTLQVILNRDEYLDFRLLRLEKGWRLKFILSDRLNGVPVILRICGVNTESKLFHFPAYGSVKDIECKFQIFDCKQVGNFKLVACFNKVNM